MKVITLCGSLRFKEEMMKVAIDLELQGNCVLTPVYPISDDKDDFTEEELINIDSKVFEKENIKYEIAQVNTVSIEDVLKREEKLKEVKDKIKTNVEIISML